MTVAPSDDKPAAHATKAGERLPKVSQLDLGRSLAVEAVAASKAPVFDAEEAEAASLRFTKAGEAERVVREHTDDGSLGPFASAEFAGAWIAWFRQDQKGALDFLLATGSGGIYDAGLRQALDGMEIGKHLELAREYLRKPQGSRIAEALGARLSAMSTADAAGMLKSASEAGGELPYARLAAGWPQENVAGFLDLAIASGSTGLLEGYLYGNPRKGSELLVLMEKRNDLPQGFSDFIEGNPELIGHLYRYADPSVPLEERIARMGNLSFLKDSTPEGLREIALKQISTVDINELMKNGPDYRYAFRHGAMTAEEILEAVRKELPAMAAASDYETRVRVFNELASEDANAAFALISHLPEEQRNLAVIHQARWTFRNTSPDAFYAMIGLAGGPDSADAASQRADAWSTYGRGAYGEYGSYYLDWVRGLPPGINRDMARSTLSKVLQAQNQPDLAKEFEQKRP
ncbi:MAG: hypothetical protein EOP85_01405 [Verrucomicrobiaceae bacterium]|nr:MAG: hypothetical protein EOP85_01405 [Verrucomicrobiaceae bacterium]